MKILNKMLKNNAGFTLIEILVSMFVVSIIVGLSVQIYTAVIRSYTRTNVSNELRQEGSRVLGEIERYVRESEDIGLVTTSYTLCDLDNALVQEGLWVHNNTESIVYQSPYQYSIFCREEIASSTGQYIIRRYDCETQYCASGATQTTNITYVNTNPIGGGLYNQGVNPTQFNLTVSSFAGKPSIVNMELTLQQPINAPGTKDYQANSTIKSSISARSY